MEMRSLPKNAAAAAVNRRVLRLRHTGQSQLPQRRRIEATLTPAFVLLRRARKLLPQDAADLERLSAAVIKPPGDGVELA